MGHAKRSLSSMTKKKTETKESTAPKSGATSPRQDPDEYLRTFPRPLVVVRFPPDDCRCTWVYAPRMSGSNDTPFVLKKVWRGMCQSPIHVDAASLTETSTVTTA
jgi:hypothetical protein